MLVIRMQRTGRKGHAMFRVVVQDSRRTPSSGKVVAWLGSYDPHAKTFQVDKEKVAFYLEHGAQPSPRVASLLKSDGVKMPKWVTIKASNTRAVRNPEKRRSTRPAEEETPAEEPEAPTAEAEVEAAEATVSTETTQQVAEESTEAPAEGAPAVEKAEESSESEETAEEKSES